MDSSQADISHHDGGRYTHSPAWALVGPILLGEHRNRNIAHQEAVSVGERGGSPHSSISSGLLCIILPGDRQEESREDKNTCGPFPYMLPQIRLFEDQNMTTRWQDTHCSKGMGHSEGVPSHIPRHLWAHTYHSGPLYNVPTCRRPLTPSLLGWSC